MIEFTPLIQVGFGAIQVATHGLMFSVGFLVAFLLARQAAKKAGLDTNVVENTLIVCLVAGLIGARVAYIAVLGRELTFIQMLKVWEGGLSSHGGYIAGILAGIIFVKYYKKLNVWKYADVLFPYLLIGWAIGRIGCLNAIGEWGWPLSHSSPFAFVIYGVTRYPTSLFETVAYLISFGLIMLLRKYVAWSRFPGVISGLTIFCFSLSRFLIDFLREYDPQYRFFTQAVTLTFVVASASFVLYKIRADQHTKKSVSQK